MKDKTTATRRMFLKSAALAAAPLVASRGSATSLVQNQEKVQEKPEQKPDQASDRAQWLAIVERVAEPVLAAISQQKLRATMPVEAAPDLAAERAQSTHLEAVGRLLPGLAPWLEADAGSGAEEEKLCSRYREWARLAIRYGADPQSPDALHF